MTKQKNMLLIAINKFRAKIYYIATKNNYSWQTQKEIKIIQIIDRNLTSIEKQIKKL